jgi:hypothetical protein
MLHTSIQIIFRDAEVYVMVIINSLCMHVNCLIYLQRFSNMNVALDIDKVFECNFDNQVL